MFENENLQPTGATSSDVPAGGGSTAGAAPLKIEAYVPGDHTLTENILHAGEIADRLDRLVIDNQPHSVLLLETSALSIALRGIASRFAVEVRPAIHIAPREFTPPDPAAFEAAMERERASQADYFSNLIDTIGPKLIAFAKQVRAESAAPLDQATHEQLVAGCEAIAQATATRIAEQSKQDVILGVNMLLKPILDRFKDAPAVLPVAPPHDLLAGDVVPAGTIKQGSKVKVWTDAAKKTFIAGTVEAVHDAGHSFDVELDTGAVAHVQAGNLALDEFAQ